MQPLTAFRKRFRSVPRNPEEQRSQQLRVGIAIYVVAALVAGAVAYVYLQPPGHREVTFLISDAAAIKPGTEVRIAGVPAGTVESTKLEKDAVRVNLSVDDSVYLGDQSSVDVRMLTIVGGYYISLTSSGSVPLGDSVIPADRATPPYSLPELMSDATDKVQQLNGDKIGESLDSLASAMEANPGGTGTLVAAMQNLAQIVHQQQDQLRIVTDASSELLHAVITDKEQIVRVVKELAIMTATLDTYKYGVQATTAALAVVLEQTQVGIRFYQRHRDWLIDNLKRVNNALNKINTDIPRIIWNTGNFVDNLRNAVSPGGLRLLPEIPLLATDMCVPTPGHTC